MNAIDKCHGKMRFASDMAAAAGAGRTSAKYGQEFRWYRCEVCLGYHLTSRPYDEIYHAKNRRTRAWAKAVGANPY